MGANLVIETTKDYTPSELRLWVKDRVNDMLHEHGHDTYAGHWGCKEPTVQVHEKRFESVEAAEEFISENNQKWDGLTACKAITTKQITFPHTKGDQELQRKRKELADYIFPIGFQEMSGFEKEVVERIRKQKSKLKTCEHCSSRVAIKHIRHVNCPVCGKEFLLTDTDRKRVEAWQKKHANIKKKIQARTSELERENVGKTKKGYVWVVGGWCPC
jgi:hypothetical protein